MTRFIAGYPCTRKTTFGDWMRDHRGYLHIDLEGARFSKSCLHAVWERCLAKKDVGEFVAQVEMLHPRVVITWGFPHHLAWVPASFRQVGARLSWFDEDSDACRAAWIRREGRESSDLERQLSALRDHREDFVRSFSGGIVSVLPTSGNYLEFLEIADIIGVPSSDA